ncbi:hypothetical protein SADUNF_Sadunf03G0007200 [Salix dunnii]|uniref:TF-B3 domain-containing protein n=1 Tax=Salix dunnii TaxID=1413687 RepID=A0A835KFM4_9ROSI|nr:hypothetical protein SADUNF_Sadunf03G0007200 [Salix dunnii]
MEIFTRKLTSMDIERGLVLPRGFNLKPLERFHGTIELSTIFESAAGNRLLGPVTIHCSTRSGDLALTRGCLWSSPTFNMRMRSPFIMLAWRIRSFLVASIAPDAMQIFRKKLTPIDIERGLVLPPDSNLELLPPFQGTMELSTIVESAAGTPLPEPVTIHCSTRSGRLAFTTGWYEIAHYVGLTGGDIVYFYVEFNEGAQYRMGVRSAG